MRLYAAVLRPTLRSYVLASRCSGYSMATQAGIIAQLEDRFQAAQASGDLFFFPSTVHRHEEAGINVRKHFFCIRNTSRSADCLHLLQRTYNGYVANAYACSGRSDCALLCRINRPCLYHTLTLESELRKANRTPSHRRTYPVCS